jgi:hypothetical protein
MDSDERYSVLTNFDGIHSTIFQTLNKIVSIDIELIHVFFYFRISLKISRFVMYLVTIVEIMFLFTSNLNGFLHIDFYLILRINLMILFRVKPIKILIGKMMMMNGWNSEIQKLHLMNRQRNHRVQKRNRKVY